MSSTDISLAPPASRPRSRIAAEPPASPEALARRRRVRRTTLVLALIASAFYVGFIAMAVYKAMH